MGYAFISYSTKNQKAADAICDLLKKHDIATWMAPGDMPAGSKYSRAINQAIIECSCFLLILSSDSQDSIWVRKELECAYSYRKSILPIRIGAVALNDEFKFYIGAKRVLTMPKADEDSEKVMKFLKRIRTATMADDGGMHDMFARQTSTQEIDYWKYWRRDDDVIPQPVGNAVVFGSYPFFQDGREKEILWDVLKTDGNRALVLSRYGLDAQPFSAEKDKVWESSSLRRWLNDVFYNEAFYDLQKEAILETLVLPDSDPEYGTYAGAACKDKLFVLSKREIESYRLSKEDLCCKASEYAIARGGFAWEGSGCCLWWLRTAGNGNNQMSYINAAGKYSSKYALAQRDEVCVRPAMWIDLSRLERQSNRIDLGKMILEP